MEKLEELKEYTRDEYYELFFNSREDIDEYTYKDTVFAIPDYRVPYLKHKLQPFLKKAEKFNVPYTFEEIGKVELKDDENQKQSCIIIRLNFSIQLNGWTFIGAIDHTPNGNIIRNASKMQLPEKFRTIKSYCEHCKTYRNRKATYIVYSEKEGFKQVGKNCLFLYTGIDLAKIAYAMDIMNYVHSYADGEGEYDDDYGYSRPCNTADAREVLALAWKLISIFGYSKKGNKEPTINRYFKAENYLNGYMKRYCQKEFKEYDAFVKENNIQFFTEDDYANADKVREWCMEQKTSSDYLHNLQVIFSNYVEEECKHHDGTPYTSKHCYMDKKYLGMVISVIPSYMRAMDMQMERIKKKDKEMQSVYIGEIGKKVNAKIVDISVLYSWEKSFNGYNYTTTFFYRLVSEEGNILTWSTARKLDRDDILVKKPIISGTVKAHNEYKGVKQTELTRCKIG